MSKGICPPLFCSKLQIKHNYYRQHYTTSGSEHTEEIFVTQSDFLPLVPADKRAISIRKEESVAVIYYL